MTAAALIPAAAALFALTEVVLRRRNPYRLWTSAFDDASVTDPHPTRGWVHKGNLDFTFYHRYLPQPNAVHLNNLGMHDSRDYARAKPRGTVRVALFGGSTAVGYELPAESTTAAQLAALLSRAHPDVRFEVMNAAVRNYCTSQLYHWYVEELAAYEPDVIVYHFNTNHPRRNVTLHESGKPIPHHQPAYVLDPSGEIRLLSTDPPTHPNDMIFLNDRWEIERIPGHTDRSLYRWLCNHLHIYSALEEVLLGPVRLREFRDRAEIKDIDKRPRGSGIPTPVDAMPYHWQVTATILGKWAEAARRSGSHFLIVPHLAFYHAGASQLNGGVRHPYGLDYEEIPERRHLPGIARELDVVFFDTYRFAREKRVDTAGFYIHPRYAYATAKGAAFQAETIMQALSQMRAKTNSRPW